jgi:hypothetical protein
MYHEDLSMLPQIQNGNSAEVSEVQSISGKSKW